MSTQGPIEEEVCGVCGSPLGNHYMACDQTMLVFHPECFSEMDCGRGEHGEGCPTSVFKSTEQ